MANSVLWRSPSRSAKGSSFPINAFIADDIELQRDQFLRVNNTKPLPRGLITELLPQVSSVLPSAMEAKKLPSALCDLLNTDDASPFKGLIIRSSMTYGSAQEGCGCGHLDHPDVAGKLEYTVWLPVPVSQYCNWPFRHRCDLGQCPDILESSSEGVS